MARDSEQSVATADTAARPGSTKLASISLHGSVLVLIQFDVCEEIRLDSLRQLLGARTIQLPTLKHPAPGYVRYQRPPVIEPIETLILRI